jgi:hypothetical protein
LDECSFQRKIHGRIHGGRHKKSASILLLDDVLYFLQISFNISPIENPHKSASLRIKLLPETERLEYSSILTFLNTIKKIGLKLVDLSFQKLLVFFECQFLLDGTASLCGKIEASESLPVPEG